MIVNEKIKPSGILRQVNSTLILSFVLGINLLAGCASMNTMAVRETEISDEALASIGIDPATIKIRDFAMCGTGKPESRSASFSQCLVVITGDKLIFVAWNKHHPEKIFLLMEAPFAMFDTVERVIYGNASSLKQIILRNTKTTTVISYSRNEVDIAENIYKILAKAGMRQVSKGVPVYAESNPDGIAPIIFPLQ